MLGLSQASWLDDIVSFPLAVIAEVEDVSLHLRGEGFELLPESGEDLPTAGDKVSDMPVRAEVADDDDGVVGQDEFFQSVLMTAVCDVHEHGVAVTAKGVLDDVGADLSGVGVVVGGLVHSHILCSLQR